MIVRVKQKNILGKLLGGGADLPDTFRNKGFY